MKKQVSDVIKRSIITGVSAIFLAYMVYLWMQGQVIVQGEYLSLNVLAYVLLGAFFVYKMVFFGIMPKIFFPIKKTKASIFVSGIALIVFGEYVLANSWESLIFVGDLAKVFGVVLTLLSFSNLLLTHNVRKVQEESTMEVIEA